MQNEALYGCCADLNPSSPLRYHTDGLTFGRAVSVDAIKDQRTRAIFNFAITSFIIHTCV